MTGMRLWPLNGKARISQQQQFKEWIPVCLCWKNRACEQGKNEWIASWVWANAHTSQMLTIDTIYYPNVCTVTNIPTEENMPPFQVVAMDLIMGLPAQKGLDTILTIMDHRCSREALFLPCSTHISGAGIAQLYLNHVHLWYGLPRKIISDRDPRFTSHFGKALTK